MIPFDSSIIPNTKGAYIVGGFVRDCLVGRKPFDCDIVFLEDFEKLARQIASKAKGSVVKLGKRNQVIMRVVFGNKSIDISPVNGGSIEDDLSKRDFTINALAYCLYSEKIIDCGNGMKDLSEKKIRMVSRVVFKEDPIRLIRAYRIGANLDFVIEPKTAVMIKNDAKLIQNTASERIKTELFKIFQMPDSHHCLSQMATTNLLFAIFPELCPLCGCAQNKYHAYDVYDHTMSAYRHLEIMLNNLNEFFPEIYIDESKQAILKCAILLHDIGKPLTKTIKNNQVHFYGHDKKSAKMAKKICSRLKFSNYETHCIDFIIRNHIRPLSLFNIKEKLKRKHLVRFFLKCGEMTPYLMLHAIADTKGKTNKDDNDFMEFAKQIINDFFSNFKKEQAKPSLINGYDLINKLGLSPSASFKKILAIVEEAQLSGNITTKDEALKLAKQKAL